MQFELPASVGLHVIFPELKGLPYHLSSPCPGAQLVVDTWTVETPHTAAMTQYPNSGVRWESWAAGRQWWCFLSSHAISFSRPNAFRLGCWRVPAVPRGFSARSDTRTPIAARMWPHWACIATRPGSLPSRLFEIIPIQRAGQGG